MESLKAYLNIVSPQLLTQIHGKPGQFLATFRQKNYLSEEAFIHEICGTKHNTNYYRELKSRTKKILQALAVVSTGKEDSLVKKKYDFCLRNFMIGQKMLNSGERKEGIRLIKLAWREAVDYDFVYFACELYSLLHYDHVYFNKNKRKAKFYADLVDEYYEAYGIEKKAEFHFLKLIEQMGRSAQPEMLEGAIAKISKLKGRSAKYQVYLYTLCITHGFHTGDYHYVVKNCKEALHYSRNRKGVYRSHFFIYWMNLGIAQMVLGSFEEAEKSFKIASEYAIAKSFNFYTIQFYKMQNAIRSGQYQIAYTLFRQCKRCPIKVLKQQFVIIEAYLCFLNSLGLLQLEKRFRLGKYLNETFKAQADKQGDNISILIAELLVLLSRDRGKFIDRIEAAQHYSYRYLNGKDTQRAKWFIKILCLLPAADFHPVALERKAKRYMDLLEKHPIHLGDNFAIEIVPFGDLLGMIMRQLERKVA